MRICSSIIHTGSASVCCMRVQQYGSEQAIFTVYHHHHVAVYITNIVRLESPHRHHLRVHKQWISILFHNHDHYWVCRRRSLGCSPDGHFSVTLIRHQCRPNKTLLPTQFTANQLNHPPQDSAEMLCATLYRLAVEAGGVGDDQHEKRAPDGAAVIMKLVWASPN